MKTITQVIDRYHMIEPGEKVIVGFSGGPDSVVLLHFLYRFGADVLAVHINHLLRGEESMRDEQFVKEFCAAYAIPLKVHRVDVAAISKEKKIGLEQAGREVRYRIFAQEAHKIHAKIATAHTLSDQAETILYRLARGSGMRGLCGIPPVRMMEDGGMIIRPLLETSREQIERYCKEHKLPFVIDSSNLEEVYARNIIRRRVIPALEQVNDATQLHLAAAAQSFVVDEDYLSEQAKSAYAQCRQQDGLSVDRLLLLHPAIQIRVKGLFLEQNGIAPDRKILERLTQLAERLNRTEPDKRYGSISLPEGKECLLRGGKLLIVGKSAVGMFPGELKLTGNDAYKMPSGKKWSFFISLTKPTQNVHKNFYYFCLDYDKIKGVINCRGRMPGDSLKITPRNITKTVKKWMNEENVPLQIRQNLFVLTDEEGVLMVEGLGVAMRVAASDQTKHFLIIKCVDDAE